MKIMDDLMETNMCLSQNRDFSWWAEMNGKQRTAVVSPWKMHYMHSGMSKGTSPAEAKLNSEKIKPLALAIVELQESEGILAGWLSVSQSVSTKFH